MKDKEQIKYEILKDFFEKFTYKEGTGYFKWREQDTPQRMLEYIYGIIDDIYEELG